MQNAGMRNLNLTFVMQSTQCDSDVMPIEFDVPNKPQFDHFDQSNQGQCTLHPTICFFDYDLCLKSFIHAFQLMLTHVIVIDPSSF